MVNKLQLTEITCHMAVTDPSLLAIVADPVKYPSLNLKPFTMSAAAVLTATFYCIIGTNRWDASERPALFDYAYKLNLPAIQHVFFS